MLENESNEEAVDTSTDAEEFEAEGTSDTVDYEAKYNEAQADIAKYKRMAEQRGKKAEKQKTNESGDFDYGQKGFMVANGITSSEFDFVKEVMADTGKSLDDVLDSKYFKNELKERREAQSVADAIPQGTKRSGQTTRDQVAYWVQKGELPANTSENQQLRRDVVNARQKASTDGTRFTSNPVVK